MIFQTVTGRRQDGHGAGDQAICPNASRPVTFEAVAVATFTSARLVSQLKKPPLVAVGMGTLVAVGMDMDVPLQLSGGADVLV